MNRAYANLGDAGFEYVATWQDDALTKRRIEAGHTFLALRAGTIVGTISLYETHSTCAYYRRDGVAFFGMFGVEPGLQGHGIGTRMLERVEREAAGLGCRELALDTAEGADRLIRYYERHGYRPVDRVDWPVTNYVSVILSKNLEL